MRVIQPLIIGWEKLCSQIPFLVHLYARPYRRVLEREIELAGITSQDRVLNIGCGSIPFTAIYIAQMTGAHVTAVDCDPQAVRAAKGCLGRLGLSHKVDLVCSPGEELDAGDCTVAVIALQAEPKDEILERLRSTATGGIRMVVREPRSVLRGHYDTLSECWTSQKSVAQDMQTFDRSRLYVV